MACTDSHSEDRFVQATFANRLENTPGRADTRADTPRDQRSPARYGFISACGTCARRAISTSATMAIAYGSIRYT